MSQNIALFDERFAVAGGVGALYKTEGFKVTWVHSFPDWNKFGKISSQTDTAIIHLGFALQNPRKTVDLSDVIKRLPTNCRRIFTSGYSLHDYSKQCLQFGGDFYAQRLTSREFLDVLN